MKIIIHSTLTFIPKVQRAPGLITVCDAISILQAETQATTEGTAHFLDASRIELRTEVETATEAIHTINTKVCKTRASGSKQW